MRDKNECTCGLYLFIFLQEIAEKGDLLEESDIFKMAMEGSDPPVTNTLLEKKGPPSLSSTTGTKASQPARIQKPSFLKVSHKQIFFC